MSDPTIATIKAIDPARRMPVEEPSIREGTRAMIVQSLPAEAASSQRAKSVPKHARRASRRPVLWISLAALAVAVAAGIAATVDRTPIASAATVKLRTLQAVSAQQQGILHTIQTQPDAGNHAIKLTFESWQDNADGRRSRESDYRNGVLFFEQASRPLAGQNNVIETLEYAPQQNVYCVTRSDGATSHAALAKGLAQKQAAWQAAHPGQALPSTAPATGVPSPLAALQAPLQAADITRVGQTVLRGQQVLVLADSEPSMHRRYYVDPQTYLPIRMLERPDGLGLVTIDYGWLPAAAQASCWFTLPSGAREVPVSQLPVHD